MVSAPSRKADCLIESVVGRHLLLFSKPPSIHPLLPIGAMLVDPPCRWPHHLRAYQEKLPHLVLSALPSYGVIPSLHVSMDICDSCTTYHVIVAFLSDQHSRAASRYGPPVSLIDVTVECQYVRALLCLSQYFPAVFRQGD